MRICMVVCTLHIKVIQLDLVSASSQVAHAYNPAPGRLRPEDCCQCKTTLNYIVSSRASCVTVKCWLKPQNPKIKQLCLTWFKSPLSSFFPTWPELPSCGPEKPGYDGCLVCTASVQRLDFKPPSRRLRGHLHYQNFPWN